jgi:DNA-directed RNA polymerase specialized sigma24 family protein
MRHHPSERIAYFGELLRLYYLEHEPTEGLASRFGKSPNQIRQDLVRARRELHSRSRRRPDDAS